jgi:hypothetical protein
MSPVARALARPVRAALICAALASAALAAPSLTGAAVARADDDPPVRVGTTLIARGDCELQKVVIARSTKLEVTAAAASTVDVALPDGAVLHRVPLNRIRYFFDVVR